MRRHGSQRSLGEKRITKSAPRNILYLDRAYRMPRCLDFPSAKPAQRHVTPHFFMRTSGIDGVVGGGPGWLQWHPRFAPIAPKPVKAARLSPARTSASIRSGLSHTIGAVRAFRSNTVSTRTLVFHMNRPPEWKVPARPIDDRPGFGSWERRGVAPRKEPPMTNIITSNSPVSHQRRAGAEPATTS